jgi:peroxiredoxin-like protein
MRDLNFPVELRWSGTGRDGVGEIHTDDLTIDLSAPESMGGRGVGTSPEELLVSAVSSCYTATLFGVLRRARLPVDSLAVDASGAVTGFPGRARFDGLTVSPTILGGDPVRQAEYEAAAILAHDRCIIGHTLAPDVTYEVSSVRVRENPVLAPAGARGSPTSSAGPLASDDADEQMPAWRSGE